MSSNQPEPADELRLVYGLNEKPPLARSLVYGLQWLIVFLPVITVLSVLMTGVMGMTPAEETGYFQTVLLVVGATMIIQTLWGHSLPLLDGPAMALVITAAAMAGSGRGAVSGGMILGGAIMLITGALGWTRRLIPLFTDQVVGVILLLIGLTILPFVLPMMLGVDPAHPIGQPYILSLSLGLAVVMGLLYHYLSGLARTLSVFVGVALGTALFALLGLIDTAAVGQAPWLAPPSPIPAVRPELNLAAALSFVLAYLAVLVNAAGSMFSLETIVQAHDMEPRLKRGVAFTGLAGMAAGLAGIVGTVPYTISPGIIAVTRVGSRYTVTVCGFMMVALSFMGKAAALLSAVPEAVVAAALFSTMAAGVGVALNLIVRSGSLDARGFLVVGLPILLGVGASLLPKAFLALLPAMIRPIAANGLIVGVVAVLLTEHVLFRRRNSS